MERRTEPIGFQIENWTLDSITKLHESDFLELVGKFRGHNTELTESFVANFY